MKKKKSVLGLILSLALLFGLIPAQKMDVEAGNSVMVDEIVLSIKEPKAGALITKEVTNAEPDKYSVLVSWEDRTNGYFISNEGQVFVQGHTYQCFVSITMAEGYTLVPNAKVYLNNIQMEFHGSSENECSYVETFEIPSRTDQPVESCNTVRVNITRPIAGANPDLEPRIEEEYANKAEIKSVKWTSEDPSWEGGAFEPETTYNLELRLYPKPGYQFTRDISVRFNGDSSEVSFDPDDPLELSAIYSFTTLKDTTIYDVGISNIQEPRAGKYISQTCICDGELYQVESEIWNREYSQDITGYFIPGFTYEHHIVLKAKEGYTFAPTNLIQFTVNGQPSSLYYVDEDRTELIYSEKYLIEDSVAGKWMSDSRGWWYQYPDGSYENDGFLKIGDSVFYFEKNGYIHTGWLYEDGDWFYFDGSGYMAEGWKYIDGNWYYFYAPEGTMLKDTETPDGYYVNESGAWIPDQWVYDESVGKYWYHYSYGGYPYDTEKQIGKHQYRFDRDGYMVTGWYYDDSINQWYYYENSGAMISDGWQWIDGECYYFYEHFGYMARDTKIDGYYVNESGVWERDHWVHNQWGWWYSYAKGGYPKSEMKEINGKIYYFDEYGYIVTGFIYMNQEWYCFDASGAMYANGWQWVDDDCYYFYKDGVMARNETIDGSYVDWSGAWVP